MLRACPFAATMSNDTIASASKPRQMIVGRRYHNRIGRADGQHERHEHDSAVGGCKCEFASLSDLPKAKTARESCKSRRCLVSPLTSRSSGQQELHKSETILSTALWGIGRCAWVEARHRASQGRSVIKIAWSAAIPRDDRLLQVRKSGCLTGQHRRPILMAGRVHSGLKPVVQIVEPDHLPRIPT